MRRTSKALVPLGAESREVCIRWRASWRRESHSDRVSLPANWTHPFDFCSGGVGQPGSLNRSARLCQLFSRLPLPGCPILYPRGAVSGSEVKRLRHCISADGCLSQGRRSRIPRPLPDAMPNQRRWLRGRPR
jgi:hypothetical protein